MKRILTLIIIMLFPVVGFSQGEQSQKDKTIFPVQAVTTKLFTVKNISFNKLIPNSEGEVLEVEFEVENGINAPQNLYIFVIASYESSYKTKSSFESPSLEDPNEIKFIKAFPEDLSNFEYSQKDKSGAEKKVYIKYPKNIKAGVDPKTGKPYLLEESIIFRTKFLSQYRKNYYFFNEITVLIFDEGENLLYRQVFKVKEKKR
ncbi:MAG TPA: hypothetical protein PK482_02575 [Spirochaetota bacterium]|nr:hypothetical protein [Spirochaetota bacterium]